MRLFRKEILNRVAEKTHHPGGVFRRQWRAAVAVLRADLVVGIMLHQAYSQKLQHFGYGVE